MAGVRLPFTFKLPPSTSAGKEGGQFKVVKIVCPGQSSDQNTNNNIKPVVTLAECIDLKSGVSGPLFNSNCQVNTSQCVGRSAQSNVCNARTKKMKSKLVESRKECHRLKRQVKRLKAKIQALKGETRNQSVKINRNQVAQYITDHLTGIKRAFVLAQIEEEKNRNGRRWGLEMVNFAALIYHQNRKCYNALASCLSLPTKKTLSRAVQKASSVNGEQLISRLAQEMKVKRTINGETIIESGDCAQNNVEISLETIMDSASDNLEMDESSVNSE